MYKYLLVGILYSPSKSLSGNNFKWRFYTMKSRNKTVLMLELGIIVQHLWLKGYRVITRLNLVSHACSASSTWVDVFQNPKSQS